MGCSDVDELGVVLQPAGVVLLLTVGVVQLGVVEGVVPSVVLESPQYGV